MEAYRHKILLVSFGKGGSTAYLAPTSDNCESRLEGYDSPETFLKGHESYDCEGALVVDVRAAVETKLGYSWVFAGPIPSASIPDGTVETFKSLGADPFFVEAVARAHPINRAILSTARVGGLDKVSLAEYARGWKAHGAKLGVVENGAILWDKLAPPVVDHPVPSMTQPDLF